MTPPADFYHALESAQSRLARQHQARYERLAWVRLVVFIAWLAGVILLFSFDWRFGLLFLLSSFPVLIWGVRQHQAIQRAAATAQTKQAIAARELRALAHDFADFDGGHELLNPAHPYALDLDIFGTASLFQLLNRTVTAPGKHTLARQLLGADAGAEPVDTTPAQPGEKRGATLASHPEWCIVFRTLGAESNDDIQHGQRLLRWLQRPPVVAGGPERFLLPLSPLLAVAGLSWMLLASPWQLGVLFFLPAFWCLRKYRAVIPAEHAYTAAIGPLLQNYAALLAHLENRPDGQAGAGQGAARALRQLAYRSGQLDVRYNPFAVLLEVTGLWSLQWLRQLDRWRAANRDALPGWLAALAAADAEVSWATLRFNQPAWTDPEWTTEPIVVGQGLAHPLLPPSGRVGNDLTLRTDGHLHLVTGSNMAGKSTWLRTVGINLVLARAGGPVCAQHLRTRPLQIWTSMRTQDNLSESTSSFFAELKRLRAIIEAVADPEQQVFFLLDEILKGTNSRDRHTGARALIRQLIRDRGAGIIATHDLELAALEKEPGGRVENYAMEVQTDGDRLFFDYRLRPGVCQSFNATALMARMGIAIPPEEIRLQHD